MSTVETLIFDDGERYPILLGEDGMPDFYVTLWVTTKLRSGKAVQTIDNRIRAIQWLYEWEKNKRRSLISEFEQGRFLTDEDMVDLKAHMKINAFEYKRAAKVKPSRKVVSLYGVPEIVTTIDSVGRNHHYNRMTAVAEYLHFVAKVVNQYRSNQSVTRAVDKMLKDFKAIRPKGKGKNVDSTEENTLPDGLLDEFVSVAHIDHLKNPFLNPTIKKRNHLMFHLLRELGIRRGELLSLELSHMDLHGQRPTIWVRRTHDDKYDPRKTQPVSKTKERKLPIKVSTANLLSDYILNERAKTPNANKHPYLFVTHKKCPTQGHPLSESAFNNMIVPIMKAADPRFAVIRPHIFRHEWNLDFSRKIDANNKLVEAGDKSKKHIEAAHEAKMRKDLMGHSSEKSADIYNQRHIREKANEAMLTEQEDLKKSLQELEQKKQENK